jgi:hypothetical protein
VGSRPVLLRAQSPREIRDRCRLWVNHTVFAGRPACLLYPRYCHDSACAASVARGYFQTFVMRQSKARVASPTDSRRAGGRAGGTAAAAQDQGATEAAIHFYSIYGAVGAGTGSWEKATAITGEQFPTLFGFLRS